MNLGIDIRALDAQHISGVDTYLRQLLNNWLVDSRGHRFFLFGTPELEKNSLIEKLVDKGHKFLPQPWPNKIFNASVKFFKHPKLDELVGERVDVFFLPNPMFHSFNNNIKTVITFHDLSFERLQSVYSFKRNLWHKIVNPASEARRASKVITVSNSTARDLNKIYSVEQDKIVVVPLGVDYDVFSRRRSVDFSLPSRYVLFLGNLEPRKNVYSLIQSFRALSEKHPDLHLVLAGSEFPEKDKRALRAAIKNSEKIVLTGPVSEENKIALYQGAQATVLLSIYEGFGLPILESFSAGTPVITSTSSSMPEVAGGAALLVNPLNIAQIAKALDLVLTNNKIRNILISRGAEVARAHSWQNTARKTLEIVESIA